MILKRTAIKNQTTCWIMQVAMSHFVNKYSCIFSSALINKWFRKIWVFYYGNSQNNPCTLLLNVLWCIMTAVWSVIQCCNLIAFSSLLVCSLVRLALPDNRPSLMKEKLCSQFSFTSFADRLEHSTWRLTFTVGFMH